MSLAQNHLTICRTIRPFGLFRCKANGTQKAAQSPRERPVRQSFTILSAVSSSMPELGTSWGIDSSKLRRTTIGQPIFPKTILVVGRRTVSHHWPPPNTACTRPPIMPALSVTVDHRQLGRWRRATPRRWVAHTSAVLYFRRFNIGVIRHGKKTHRTQACCRPEC